MKPLTSLADRAKTALRRIPAAAAVNAAARARATLSEYRALERHYAAVHAGASPAPLPALPQLHIGVRRPRLLFVGTDEEQDRSGFIQALERRCELTVFTKADGSYGQNDPRPPAIRRAANRDRLLAILASLRERDAYPDIVLAQTWATLIDPAAFDQARAGGACVINLSLDDRHQFRGRRDTFGWSGTLGLVGHIDLALTAAQECVRWYQAEGCPALYFPEASDPSIFAPLPVPDKQHDICFVGGRYGIRERLVLALRAAGMRVTAFGSGWEGGRIDVPGMARLFAQSRIVLGVGTIGHCTDFHALKLRDFDAPMTGSCYLTHDNADLHALYEVGREIETYRSIDDCVARARALIDDAARRESIGAAGRTRALRDHTWDRRFADLFATLAIGSCAASTA